MNRRSVLRKSTAGAALLSISGCLGRGSGILGLGPCPSNQPMSANMQNGGGSIDECNKGASTSLAVENEREETITATVSVESDSGNEVYGETHTLEPGEREVHHGPIPAHDDHTASVTVEGEEPVIGSWNGVSCLRHGIAIRSDNVLFGYRELYGGRADGDHGCYKGTNTVLIIFNRNDDPSPQTVHVEILNKCTDETVERTVDIAPGDFAEISESLAVGGDVTISVDVEGGGSATREFSGLCGGLSSGIESDGEIDLRDYIA